MVSAAKYVAPNDELILSISMDLTSVANVTMLIDFDDGVRKSFDLSYLETDTDASSGHVDRSLDVGDGVVFRGDYSSSCKLSADVMYSYRSAGVYCATVTLASGSFSASTRLQNETCITVENFISEVLLVGPSVAAVGQNITVKAVLPVYSGQVTYDWTAQPSDVDSETSLMTPVAIYNFSSRWIFGMQGLYTISVTAGNAVSSLTNATMVNVVIPVSGLTINCSSSEAAGLYFAVNSVVQCTASTKQGSGVRFIWNFDNGTPSVVTANSSISRVKGSFSRVGRYNVSVLAVNSYNRLSSYVEIDLVESVRSLSVVAETGRAGEPVTVTACCKYGSNLTFVFEFSGDNTRIEDRPPSTVGVVRKVYSAAGVYTASVLVYNAISNLTASFEVKVQPVVSNVVVTVVSSAPVAGRTIVFTATIDGKLIYY
jgi:hypothetical protein